MGTVERMVKIVGNNNWIVGELEEFASVPSVFEWVLGVEQLSLTFAFPESSF